MTPGGSLIIVTGDPKVKFGRLITYEEEEESEEEYVERVLRAKDGLITISKVYKGMESYIYVTLDQTIEVLDAIYVDKITREFFPPHLHGHLSKQATAVTLAQFRQLDVQNHFILLTDTKRYKWSMSIFKFLGEFQQPRNKHNVESVKLIDAFFDEFIKMNKSLQEMFF